MCSLLAHLLFLRANGGTEYATALADTFGTKAFVEAALVTQVPDEFIQDIRELYPEDRQIEPGRLYTRRVPCNHHHTHVGKQPILTKVLLIPCKILKACILMTSRLNQVAPRHQNVTCV